MCFFCVEFLQFLNESLISVLITYSVTKIALRPFLSAKMILLLWFSFIGCTYSDSMTKSWTFQKHVLLYRTMLSVILAVTDKRKELLSATLYLPVFNTILL